MGILTLPAIRRILSIEATVKCTRVSPSLFALPKDTVRVTLQCEEGHPVEAGMTVILNTQTGEYNAIGGSDWDFCEDCGLMCSEDLDDCRDECSHGHRSDASREAGHVLVAQIVDTWWADNSVPINLN